MPAYNVSQPGYNPAPNEGKNLTCLVPGDNLTLFDGTETAAQGLASVAMARGYSPGAGDNGITFDASGMPSDCVIDIQVANQDIDGQYFTVGSISADANGNGGYTDIGRSAFYRAKLATYTTGAMPKVIAQR